MSEQEEVGTERRPIWLTPEQWEWVDIQVARRRREVAEKKDKDEGMPFINRSTVFREWIDEQIGAAA